jgi:steroid 5-alpha reductase family enzyme
MRSFRKSRLQINGTHKLEEEEIMENTNIRSLVGILIILVVAAGLAFAGSQGGSEINGVPIYAIGVALAFIVNWIAFIPAYIQKTEKFFDLTGSFTYITVLIVAVTISPGTDARSLLLLGIIAVWAIRLGTFLFMRIRAAGEDRRFREIKKSFARFLLTWTLQGLWVSFSLAAALATITSLTRVELGIFALVGFLVWLFGFSVEVIADRQKGQFKADPGNQGKFINTGLWSWSRHPNYFGEIVLWIGVALVALPVLRGWQFVTLISPIFVVLLLTRISGIPMLEKRADEKWGGQEDYEAYKSNTSILVPRPPTNR